MNTNKNNFNYTAVILAGGLGTRMRSEIPKGLMPILEKPMIYYVIAELLKLNEEDTIVSNAESGASATSGGRNILSRIIIVIGHKGELIKDYIESENAFKNCGIAIDFAIQDKYLGTGDAAKRAAILIKNTGSYNGNICNHGSSRNNGGDRNNSVSDTYNNDNDKNKNGHYFTGADTAATATYDDAGVSNVLILPCDAPLITKNTLYKLLKFHDDFNDDLTVLSFETENPFSYGRVLKDDKNFVKKIVEQQEIDVQMKNESRNNINIKKNDRQK
jgi:bifunctional N-acetylglucosamine-1-phosphate-uridyltransferase/glucosamine-1-phosphate-acetyltransferase GlmU-like protein